MTQLDGMNPWAALAEKPAGNKGGNAKNWDQAMEQAQAKAWLQGRTTAQSTDIRPGSEAGQPLVSRESPAKVAARRDSSAIPVSSPRQGETRPHAATAAHAPLPAATRAAIDVLVLNSSPMHGPKVEGDAQLLRTIGTGAWANAGNRPRRQSLHLEQDEQGVRLWIRDAAMDEKQAGQLAQAVLAELGQDEAVRRLQALYLNGLRQQPDRKE